MITGESVIGYSNVKGPKTFRSFNAASNKENPWIFYQIDRLSIDEAVNKASDAFPLFSAIPDEDKARFLEEIVRQIEGLGDELLKVYCQESSLTTSRAKIELTRTLFQLNSFAELLRSNWREVTFEEAQLNRNPVPKPDLRKTYIPIGPIVVFGSSNFPFAYSTAGGDTASALAAGCPVIVKGHPMHAGTGEMVARAIQTAAKNTNMPDGVFSNLHCFDIDLAQYLVQHEGIKGVGFTGSISGGRAIFNSANQRRVPIPVFAEMGSVNPVVLSEESLKTKADSWASKYAESILSGVGQFCTSPGLFIGIMGPSLDEFSMKLAERLNASPRESMLHPKIASSFYKLRNKANEQPGIELITRETNSTKSNQACHTLLKVPANEFIKNPRLHEEVFGPFAIVVECSSLSEILSVVGSLEGQLTGTMIVENVELKAYEKIKDALLLRVGRIIFNGVSTGVEVCPAMQHGGPYPASTDSRFTAVGTQAIRRWIRPITFQNFPMKWLPNELK